MKDTLRLLLLTIVFAGCRHGERETNRTFQEGSFTIKARFVDGRRSGRTEVIDSLGRLSGVLNYNNDSMSGICIHYFPDGVVSDSVMYRCDKPQGYWRHYAQDGDLRHINYFYFGLQFGPDLWYYKDRILKSFSFLDFEREPIVECNYNTHGNLDSIRKMDLKVILTDKDKNGLPVVEFFAYLPQIPLTEDSYSIGLADKNHVKQKLCDIQGQNFLIDTMLSAPPPGYHWYLRCDIKGSGGFHDIHIVEMIKTEESEK